MGRARAIAVGLSVVLVGSTAGSAARADRIEVRNGSVIKGKAIPDDAHPDQYLVFGEKGKTPIVLKKERVVRIVAEPSVLDGYADRRKAMSASGATTAQAEFDLASWCEEHKLRDLATLHHEAALKRDSTFAPAHQKLGHVQYGGKWLTAAEMKAAQGYTLHKGKWITPEEKEQRDAEASVTAEHQTWIRRLAILRQQILSGSESKARDAEAQVTSIREEAAVNPLIRTFGNDGDPALRKLAALSLSLIPGPKASAALVGRLLAEPEDEVRQATMDLIARSKEPNIVPKLVEGLRSTSLPVVNRAAWGLGNLNAASSVPKLIPNLVRVEEQMVWVPGENSTNLGFGGGVGGGVVPNAGNRHVAGSATGLGNAGFSSGISIPVLTGPVVGPGVVAYGATSVPVTSFGSGIPPGGAGGVGTGGAGRGPQPVIVQVPQANVEVHAALVKLTGKDFGYDIATWKRWLSTAYQQPESAPAKKVPQP